MRFFPIHGDSLSVVFGAGLVILWLLVAGYAVRNLPTRAILCLTGHLRARPDPWLEATLRKAFAEFDRELAVILHDRGNPQNKNPQNKDYPERPVLLRPPHRAPVRHGRATLRAFVC